MINNASEIDKQELQECYTVLRNFLDRRTQLVTFFGTVNLTLIGLSIQYKNYFLLVIAGFTLFFFLVIDYLLVENLLPYLYVGISIEEKLNRNNGLITCEVLSHSNGSSLIQNIRKVRHSEDINSFSKTLQSISSQRYLFRSSRITPITALIGLIEILIGLLT